MTVPRKMQAVSWLVVGGSVRDGYVRGRSYGWPIRTSRTYGPYVRPVRTASAYRP